MDSQQCHGLTLASIGKVNQAHTEAIWNYKEIQISIGTILVIFLVRCVLGDESFSACGPFTCHPASEMFGNKYPLEFSLEYSNAAEDACGCVD